MSNNNFPENFFFGVKKYRHLLEIFYRRYCYEGRYVFIDKSRFSNIIQRTLKTDTVIQKNDDVSHGIEEKTVAWPESKGRPHTAFFLETRSCTNPGHESPGWMVTCVADYLLYSFEIKDLGLVSYIIDFPCLQRWFKKVEKHYRIVTMPDQNRTEGRLVDIAHVLKYIPSVRCFLVSFEGECREMKPDVDVKRLRAWHLEHQQTTQRVNQVLSSLPSTEKDEGEEEECGDWREVQQRVEEILAQQEADEILQWIERAEERL